MDAAGRLKGRTEGEAASCGARRLCLAITRRVMKKIVQFVKESYAELRKVIWPSREDVISSVKVVIVSTVIVAAILGLVDLLLLFGIRAIF